MTSSEPRVNAPEFPSELEWLHTERPLTLRELRGKIVLLEFWTFCCINCHHNIPQLRQLRAQFGDELVIIGVHSAKFPAEQLTANIREAVLRHEISYPVINDADLRIWDEYAVRAWPTIVLIDDRGKVVRTQSGEMLADELMPVIQSLVALADLRGTLNRQPIAQLPATQHEPLRPLRYPSKLLVIPDGRLFVADTGHHRVIELRLEDNGLSATVKRVFGSGEAALRDGVLMEAAFHNPHGMDLHSDTLYVADTDNHAIRAVDLTSGAVRTLAGTGVKAHGRIEAGLPTATPLRSPWDVLVTDEGVLLIAMAGAHQIWRLTDDAQLTVWAGAGFEALLDGPRDRAGFNQPSDIDSGGDLLFVADAEASAIRSIPLGDRGDVQTLVGQGLFAFGDSDGASDDVRLQHPTGLAWFGGMVVIADSYNHKIKMLDPNRLDVKTLIGTGAVGHTDGPFLEATLFEPEGLAIALHGATPLIYIADTNNHLIRVGDLETSVLHTLRLHGLERLGPQQAAIRPITTLAPITVGAGTVTLAFDIAFPAGYKRNPDAPLVVGVVDSGAVQIVPADAAPTLSLDRLDDRDVTIELTVYYCAVENAGLCRIHTARLLLPLCVASDGATTVSVRYAIPDQ